MFISTRKMFRFTYDDEEKKNLLEGAVRVWILMAQNKITREGLAGAPTGGALQAFVDLWKFRYNAEMQAEEMDEMQRLHLWAMGVQDAGEDESGRTSALHRVVQHKSTKMKNKIETMPQSILIHRA